MGCCASSPASPYNGGNASSRNPIISQQPQSNAATGRPSTARTTGPQGQAGAQARTDPPDRTLQPLVWTSTDRTWTRQEIDKEREDFFFTRVTGRQEVWQTIKTALEVIWAGGDPVDQDGGIKTAHEILKAASITLPHSTLDRGVFDLTGVFYSLPQYVVCDPTNLAADDPGLEDPDAKNAEVNKIEAVSDEEDAEEVQRRREDKGKGVADPENEEIQLKARRSDAGTRDLVITAGKKDTVRQLTRKFSQSGGLKPPKRIQLYYMGRILDEDKTLGEQGWKGEHMLQAFVSEARSQHS